MCLLYLLRFPSNPSNVRENRTSPRTWKTATTTTTHHHNGGNTHDTQGKQPLLSTLSFILGVYNYPTTPINQIKSPQLITNNERTTTTRDTPDNNKHGVSPSHFLFLHTCCLFVARVERRKKEKTLPLHKHTHTNTKAHTTVCDSRTTRTRRRTTSLSPTPKKHTCRQVAANRELSTIVVLQQRQHLVVLVLFR